MSIKTATPLRSPRPLLIPENTFDKFKSCIISVNTSMYIQKGWFENWCFNNVVMSRILFFSKLHPLTYFLLKKRRKKSLLFQSVVFVILYIQNMCLKYQVNIIWTPIAYLQSRTILTLLWITYFFTSNTDSWIYFQWTLIFW